MPPPEPRSRTVSPAFNSASAVGLPQPSEAFMAVSGTSPCCVASYRFEVIGSQQSSSADAPPQQELPAPDWTRNAACPYFSLTTSFTFGLVIRVLSLAYRDDALRLDSLIAGAAFCV